MRIYEKGDVMRITQVFDNQNNNGGTGYSTVFVLLKILRSKV